MHAHVDVVVCVNVGVVVVVHAHVDAVVCVNVGIVVVHAQVDVVVLAHVSVVVRVYVSVVVHVHVVGALGLPTKYNTVYLLWYLGNSSHLFGKCKILEFNFAFFSWHYLL